MLTHACFFSRCRLVRFNYESPPCPVTVWRLAQVIGTVEALFDFTASDSVGLSFRYARFHPLISGKLTDHRAPRHSRGDKINVHQQNETGWWEGSLPDGKRGWFPSNFTTTIGEEGAAVVSIPSLLTMLTTTPT